jgi:hypothetical protein
MPSEISGGILAVCIEKPPELIQNNNIDYNNILV